MSPEVHGYGHRCASNDNGNDNEDSDKDDDDDNDDDAADDGPNWTGKGVQIASTLLHLQQKISRIS